MENNSLPGLVSICVPTYNGEKYLNEALECIVSQTYENLEILIVDDQSTDDTIKIVQNFIQRDSRIKLHINEQNLGLVANWNQCIALASGTWVKLHFQDDLMKPETIGVMMDMAQKEGLSCILTEREFIFEDNLKDPFVKLPRLSHYFQESSVLTPSIFCNILQERGIRDNFVGEPIIGLVKKDLFAIYGNYDETLKQIVDFEFWLRIGLNINIGYIPDQLHQFRIHQESQGAKNVGSTEVSIASIDKVILSYKLLNDKGFKLYRERVSRMIVYRQTVRDITNQIFANGYFRMRRKLDKKHFEMFDGKVNSWVKALFNELLFAIHLK